MHTARIGFVLPDGIAISSMGGFDSAAVAAVPEPSTWLLLAIGLGMTARLSRPRGAAAEGIAPA